MRCKQTCVQKAATLTITLTRKQRRSSATTAMGPRSCPREAAKLDPTVSANGASKESSRRKKRITKFAWADGKKSVSVFVDMVDVPQDGVQVDWEKRKVVATLMGEHELILDPLHDDICDVRVKIKPSKVVLALKKATADVSWYQLTTKK